MGFKPMSTIRNIFQLMKYQMSKPWKFRHWWDSNPRQNIFQNIKEIKRNDILKERAYGISKEKAYNILALMTFKPMTPLTKYFPAYEISKEKVFKIQWDSNPWPYQKYFPAYELSKENWASKIQAFVGFKPMDQLQNLFQLMKYQKRKPMKY